MNCVWPIALASVICLRAADLAAHHADQAGELPTISTSGEAAPLPSTSLPGKYVPPDRRDRAVWVIDGTVGRRSLGIGVFNSALQTTWDSPREWGRSWSGASKRYIAREADVALSNTIEAGLGALWGEDPRYFRAPRSGFRSRLAHAAKAVLLAPRADGHLAPAWGRYAGNTVNNVIENAWLPPSQTTGPQTVFRSMSGLFGRFAGNLWDEFWPDIQRRLHHHRSSAQAE